jgi:uncharacterized protein
MNSTNTLDAKERALHDTLRSCGSVLIGYSGGVDSAYLAKASLDALGPGRVLAVTGRSPSYPLAQHEVAVSVARILGLTHVEIDTYELEDPGYASNPANRCYYCKTELYSKLTRLAQEEGYETVVDGSNADDVDDFRPGMVAARELGVRSPLQEAGLTKAEIRELSRRADLPTWESPASPCLASRIPYGLAVTERRLGQIEEGEALLRAVHSWKELRVRHHGDWARLELESQELALMVDGGMRERVAHALKKAGFSRVCVDLQGYRSGALNEATRMSRDGESGGDDQRAPEAERRLAEIGIPVRVEDAGGDTELAVVHPNQTHLPSALLGELRDRVVHECKAAGFRFVALETC